MNIEEEIQTQGWRKIVDKDSTVLAWHKVGCPCGFTTAEDVLKYINGEIVIEE